MLYNILFKNILTNATNNSNYIGILNVTDNHLKELKDILENSGVEVKSINSEDIQIKPSINGKPRY